MHNSVAIAGQFKKGNYSPCLKHREVAEFVDEGNKSKSNKFPIVACVQEGPNVYTCELGKNGLTETPVFV